jgi:hypothetical protein
VHLRRALLLFAIVLGLAALAASVSQPRRDEERAPDKRAEAPPRAPTATPRRSGPDTTTITFAARKPSERPVAAGRPAVVLVKVRAPGQVEIPELGLGTPADPVTPARFDVLALEPGRYDIRFTSARGGRTVRAGSLMVRHGGERR